MVGKTLRKGCDWMNNEDRVRSKSIDSNNDEMYNKIVNYEEDLVPLKETFSNLVNVRPNNSNGTGNTTHDDNKISSNFEDLDELAYKVCTNYDKFSIKIQEYLDGCVAKQELVMVNSRYFKIHTDLITNTLFNKLNNLECCWYITYEEYIVSNEGLNLCIHMKWDWTKGQSI